jgi:hypothetical protein
MIPVLNNDVLLNMAVIFATLSILIRLAGLLFEGSRGKAKIISDWLLRIGLILVILKSLFGHQSI